jgi:hypothetical protein
MEAEKMGMGIMNKAFSNVKNRKDTTPTLDAQVVDLPEGDKNEKQIVIQRPDNDEDKSVNLPVASGGNGLVPPDEPKINTAAFSGGGEIAPIGNRDVAEDVEFTVNSEEPEGIEGYKQAGESWHKGEEEEPEKIEADEKLAIEDQTESDDEEDEDDDDTKQLGNDEKKLLEDKRNGKKKSAKKTPKTKTRYIKSDDETTDLSNLLNSGATNFSINDIVEGEPEIPHYQYRSLLRR